MSEDINNSLALRVYNERKLHVAWFLQGYNARDNNDAMRIQIAKLQEMAKELEREAGA